MLCSALIFDALPMSSSCFDKAYNSTAAPVFHWIIACADWPYSVQRCLKDTLVTDSPSKTGTTVVEKNHTPKKRTVLEL